MRTLAFRHLDGPTETVTSKVLIKAAGPAEPTLLLWGQPLPAEEQALVVNQKSLLGQRLAAPGRPTPV